MGNRLMKEKVTPANLLSEREQEILKRLALRVAAEVAEMFADGVCFVGGTPSILSSWQNAPSRSCGWRVMIIGPDDSNWNWKICVRYWNGRQAAERWCKGYD